MYRTILETPETIAYWPYKYLEKSNSGMAGRVIVIVALDVCTN